MGKFEPADQRAHALSGAPADVDKPYLAAVVEEAEEWTIGRSWVIRIPLLLYLGYALIKHVFDPLYGTFLFSGITLAIHELGHVLFGWAPFFVTAFAGTGAQLAAPLATAWIFLRQPDFFGVAVAGMWLSYSMFNMATYMADARDRFLPLVSVGSGEAIHDWEYMLTALGLLQADKVLGGFTRVLASVVGLVSLAGALLLCHRMHVNRGRRPARISW